MINDLERDSLFFTEKIAAYETILKNHIEYLDAAYSDQKTYDDYVQVTRLINLDSENFVAQNATYLELMNSGHLNLFKNKPLKLSIIAHYREYQRVQNHIGEFNEYSTKVLSRIPLGHATFYNAYKPPDSVLRHPDQWGWINDHSSERFIFNTDIAALYATKHAIFIDYYHKLVAECHSLKKTIFTELRLRE